MHTHTHTHTHTHSPVPEFVIDALGVLEDVDVDVRAGSRERVLDWLLLGVPLTCKATNGNSQCNSQ